MISAITGKLTSIAERTAHLQCGPLEYELLVPASDVQSLSSRTGVEVTFHTILYLEGDPGRGGLEPRLIGFSTARDKAFFEKFTTVKGIGTRTALRALSVPASQIASAIEQKNARFLVQLEGIGKRTAELIIAELSGKLTAFALADTTAGVPASTVSSPFTATELDALNALVGLGERRADAERLLDQVRQRHGQLPSTDALLREMFRMRAS